VSIISCHDHLIGMSSWRSCS